MKGYDHEPGQCPDYDCPHWLLAIGNVTGDCPSCREFGGLYVEHRLEYVGGTVAEGTLVDPCGECGSDTVRLVQRDGSLFAACDTDGCCRAGRVRRWSYLTCSLCAVSNRAEVHRT